MTRIHQHHFTVPAEAIDFYHHVNNIEYLRWMQEVAVAHSTALGWPLERYFREHCAWVIRSHFIEYLLPAHEHDELVLLTWVSGISERASTRKYLFWRPRDRQIIARAETVWVFVDLRSKLPTPIIDAVRAAFTALSDEGEVQHLLDTL
jgi:acyl-CoA thioester hydrolase